MNQHLKILRPRGISGYAPKSACSVCGLAAARDETKKCVVPSCPNICHESCLLDQDQQFDCENVVTLRTIKNITCIVEYEDASDNSQTQNTARQDTQDSEEIAAPQERDILLELSKEQLVDRLLTTRQELRTSGICYEGPCRCCKDHNREEEGHS